MLGLVIDDGVSNRGHRKNIFSKDFKYVGISSRVQGDKIITVIDFHSENVGTKNVTQNNNNAGNNLQYEKKGYECFDSAIKIKGRETSTSEMKSGMEVEALEETLALSRKEEVILEPNSGVNSEDLMAILTKMTDGDSLLIKSQQDKAEESFPLPQTPRLKYAMELKRLWK